MIAAEALAACEETVHRADPDRYFAVLFAPGEKRLLLYALYAFNHEIARASGATGDPLAAEIRLQWRREAVGDAREGRPPVHPVAVGLAELLSKHPGEATDLDALIDARILESSPAPFPTLAAMECHAHATSARLMRIAARVVSGATTLSALADEAGTAYGLTGMLRNFGLYAHRGRCFLPCDLLAMERMSSADIAPGKHAFKLKRVIDEVGRCARDHFLRANGRAVSRAELAAVLPASLVPAYVSRLAKNVDPFQGATDVLRARKQLIMLRTALLGRL